MSNLKINNCRASRTFVYIMITVLTLEYSSVWAKPSPKVLVFCKTTGYHHASIPAGIAAIKKLGLENNFDVDTTTDSRKFNYENLKQYAALIFLSPTEKVFDTDQENAFKQYIEAGGGFVGIHGATECETHWQWYGNLIGAFLKGHPSIQPGILNVVDSTFTATSFLPRNWKWTDEWYTYKWMAPNLHILITIDENSYNLEKEEFRMGAGHPVAWYHEYDGGRSFYTALGHTDEAYSDPLYLRHLLGGIKYAMGIK